MPQAQRLWASFQDVLVAYARAVILWMNGEIEITGLPHWRCLRRPLRLVGALRMVTCRVTVPGVPT